MTEEELAKQVDSLFELGLDLAKLITKLAPKLNWETSLDWHGYKARAGKYAIRVFRDVDYYHESSKFVIEFKDATYNPITDDHPCFEQTIKIEASKLYDLCQILDKLPKPKKSAH